MPNPQKANHPKAIPPHTEEKLKILLEGVADIIQQHNITISPQEAPFIIQGLSIFTTPEEDYTPYQQWAEWLIN